MAKQREAEEPQHVPACESLSDDDSLEDDWEQLPPAQRAALAAMVSHRTMRGAAQEAKVSEASLYRWQRQEPFRSLLRQARSDATNQALSRAQLLSGEAIDNLGELMKDAEQAGSVRVAASRAIVDYSIKAVEIGDIKVRLEAVEAAIAAAAEDES